MIDVPIAIARTHADLIAIARAHDRAGDNLRHAGRGERRTGRLQRELKVRLIGAQPPKSNSREYDLGDNSSYAHHRAVEKILFPGLWFL
jgi:hypothetical protein